MLKLDSGFSSRARVLNAIQQRWSGMNDSQRSSKRVLTQVKVVYEAIQAVEMRNRNAANGALAKYKNVVLDFLKCLENYHSKNVFQRLIHHRKKVDDLERIQGIVTVLLRMLSMEMAAEIEAVKQQWKVERCELHDQLGKLLEDASASLLELQNVRDAMLLLQSGSAKAAMQMH
ncbi:hypothetical protein PHYSODRAFT_342962 [Phytophthora sojae]|uniref:Uncharacterized protein n=1 Tax=Phytophthora sojae (strain P6497) TaxID=1094619 RepID=G5AI46_PHYSP|nr:hypothetical protein PHYSODRAFT_261320 [Phytophthora sojae]XP_009539747.1 hypothetical protein PHYSODRAFT_342962 [Phytophthora sojae]EGZ04771.1 hypothetical protein PHYSODRAFT_342962 [Phytophthora sojae]EGZ18179.1 hypothetical protein PHYSODRAFT_261320 [Phytophthora sojae]|eukprot:XP_009527237.1 hypothetical protein PHYSODRAFT_261320 [Phytophthora sojae]